MGPPAHIPKEDRGTRAGALKLNMCAPAHVPEEDRGTRAGGNQLPVISSPILFSFHSFWRKNICGGAEKSLWRRDCLKGGGPTGGEFEVSDRSGSRSVRD